MNLHIRVTLESESIPDSRYDHARDKDRATWSLSLFDALTGDGKDAAFRAFFPRRTNLGPQGIAHVIERAALAGHHVSGDRAAVAAFGLPSR